VGILLSNGWNINKYKWIKEWIFLFELEPGDLHGCTLATRSYPVFNEAGLKRGKNVFVRCEYVTTRILFRCKIQITKLSAAHAWRPNNKLSA